MEKYTLEKINVKAEDIILIKAQIENLDFNEMREIYKKAKKIFSNNVVFMIPQGIEIQIEDWKRVYNYLLSIKPEK